MRDDFKTALSRVQSDYAFFIQCQSDPAKALADYSLSPEERATLRDPERLADALKRGRDPRLLPSITIKISGTHDWINRTPPKRKNEADELIAREVESVKRAVNDDERGEAALRLIQLLG
jgi:hypothetical protein